ncbi:hypothetical protein BDN70DRAFT_897285 [Pholiota conissans]|uniref:Uncharacterized protein n=1 Tax=Pholiota conissans TaxID=109636 RepID=A0A9P5YYU8_9AGAR|nr:hypothetical protein BDN70DRAFT_897285 [Pholiota conissans]
MPKEGSKGERGAKQVNCRHYQVAFGLDTDIWKGIGNGVLKKIFNMPCTHHASTRIRCGRLGTFDDSIRNVNWVSNTMGLGLRYGSRAPRILCGYGFLEMPSGGTGAALPPCPAVFGLGWRDSMTGSCHATAAYLELHPSEASKAPLKNRNRLVARDR